MHCMEGRVCFRGPSCTFPCTLPWLDNHVLILCTFHVLLKCRLQSSRLRAHNWSKLARLCPVHLFNLGAETGVLGKGLLHKPVPPLAKARWHLRLTVFAQEYHLSTGLLIAESPRSIPMLIFMPVDFRGHSVNIPIFKSSSGEERKI